MTSPAKPLDVRRVESTEQDRHFIAHALSDASYQGAYQATDSLHAMRDGTAAVTAHPYVRQLADGVDVRPETLAGVPCEWITPEGTADATGLIVYVHGGGFVRGSLALGRANAAHIATRARMPVLAIGYRQAPEHPYPAAPDDVQAVYLALLVQGRPAQRLVLVGESSGGCLALGLLARLPLGNPSATPAGIAALSPMTDLSLSGASWVYNAPLDVADIDTGRKMVTMYLGTHRIDDPDASPIHHDFSRSACPLLLMVGSHETMLSDAERLARRAADAGVDVRFDVYVGMPHGFTRFRAPVADAALEAAADWCAALLR